MHSYVFPGDIDTRIAAIGAEPFMYMRTDAFSRINKESERMLLDLIHCPGGRTIIYTGSGTGAMSAVVENYVTTKKKAFVIDGGSFGHRWFQLCDYYGVPVYNFKIPFAKDIDYLLLEQTVASEKPDVFLCQHHETSSGQLFDLEKISGICHRYGVSLVVDVISTFLAEPLDMGALDIDICITSTQKGLNIPPGLSILFFSPKLDGYTFNHKGYYWDSMPGLTNWWKKVEKTRTSPMSATERCISGRSAINMTGMSRPKTLPMPSRAFRQGTPPNGSFSKV